MGRELKFRAWNGRAMEYGGFAIHATGSVMNMAEGLSNVLPSAPIMQFTGLHDKNGVEIYEGDIVRDYDDRVHEVKYYSELYWDGGGSNHPGFYLSGGFSGYGDDDFDMNYHVGFGGCEIIGDIHQNPELLP